MRAWSGLVGGALLLLGAAGCVETELAQTPPGSIEAEWQTMLEKSYPAWRAPRLAPPGIRDNMSPDYVAEETRRQQEGVEAETPAADPDVEPDPTQISPEEEIVEETVVVETGVTEEPAAAEESVTAEEPAAEPAPAVAVEYEEYVVQPGDSLSLIAKKFYKDGRRYFPIFKANEQVLNGNPNLLRPGMKLRIPKL